MAGIVLQFPPDQGNRREVVKATPMQTMLAVLTEACSRGKKPLDPNLYILMNGKKEVDLTLTVRFAGLPGGAKLDVVPRPAGYVPPAAAPQRPPPRPAPAAEAASVEPPGMAEPAAATAEDVPSTSGQEDTQMEDAAASDADLKAEALVGRRMRIFSRAGLESLPAVEMEEVDDSFFEFTADDFQYVIRHSSAHKPAPIMMTKEMRERQEEEKARSFARALIRVQLPDGHVIESAFAPLDTVRDVQAAVAAACAPGAPLYLFTAPPKARLDPAATLFKAGLVPAARVFAGLEAAAAAAWEGKALLLPSVGPLIDAELPKLRAAREAAAAEQQARKAAMAAAQAAAAQAAAAQAAAAAASGSGAGAGGEAGGEGPRAGREDDGEDGSRPESLGKKLAAGGKPKWMKL